MKPPDDTKEGLERCGALDGDCENCPYDDGLQRWCVDRLRKDSLAYIKQLESSLAQVERERDALMHDFHLGMECNTCKHEKTDCLEFPCKDCIETTRSCYILRWEWRGVCDENTKEG